MPSSLGRVLVVDDEPHAAAMVHEALVEFGYVVRVSGRGAEALRLVPVFKPDVVLLDLMMPEMPGVEVLAHLRRARPTLPVVILTANEDVELARATLRDEVFDYQYKPVRVDVLARVVAAAVARPATDEMRP